MILLVEELDLLHRQVQEGQIISDNDGRFRSFAAHGSAQTSVQLDHDQLGGRIKQTNFETIESVLALPILA